MANCYYCTRHGPAGQAACGVCADVGCLTDVCLDACPRRDGIVHGARCQCGCGSIFCQVHWDHHAEEEGSDVPTCFPDGSFSAALPVWDNSVSSARSDEHGRASREEREAANRLLNFVAPGSRALIAFLPALDDRTYEVDSLTWPNGETEFVSFQEPFFDAAARERLLVLSTRILRHTGRRSGRIGMLAVKHLRTDDQAELLKLLGAGLWTPAGLERIETLDVPAARAELARWISVSEPVAEPAMLEEF